MRLESIASACNQSDCHMAAVRVAAQAVTPTKSKADKATALVGEAKALDYRAQAQEHESMIAAYKANSSLSTKKNRASTIGHCEYFDQTFKDKAVKSHELAQLHEQMDKDWPKTWNRSKATWTGFIRLIHMPGSERSALRVQRPFVI